MADLDVTPGELTSSQAAKMRQDSATLERLRRDSETSTRELGLQFIRARLTEYDATTGFYTWREDKPSADPTEVTPIPSAASYRGRYTMSENVLYGGRTGLVSPQFWNPAIAANPGNLFDTSRFIGDINGVDVPYRCILLRGANSPDYGTIWEILPQQSPTVTWENTQGATLTGATLTATIYTSGSLYPGTYMLTGQILVTIVNPSAVSTVAIGQPTVSVSVPSGTAFIAPSASGVSFSFPVPSHLLASHSFYTVAHYSFTMKVAATATVRFVYNRGSTNANEAVSSSYNIITQFP